MCITDTPCRYSRNERNVISQLYSNKVKKNHFVGSLTLDLSILPLPTRGKVCCRTCREDVHSPHPRVPMDSYKMGTAKSVIK